MIPSRLSTDQLGILQRLDTCTVSNAVERLNGRLRDEGSISGSIVHCVFPQFAPMLGYAATGRIRSTSPPVVGRGYHENMNWWRYVATIPEPRVLVLQDMDRDAGPGALVGEIHTLIAMALGCVGYVTNGAARDLPAIEAMGFHLFCGSVAVSHKYAHVCEYGQRVEIGGLNICPGDLIHGDRHGVQTIPLSIAPDIAKMVAEMRQEERALKIFCRSPKFSLRGLEQKLDQLPGDGVEIRLR